MSSTQPRFPVSMRVALNDPHGAVAAEVTDVSTGGMFVRTERVLPVGASVSAALEIPDGGSPAAVNAKVIHVAAQVPSARTTSRVGFGAQFVSPDASFCERMDRYMEAVERATNVPVRVLLVARDLLYERGWTQFAFRDRESGYCLSGALADAVGDDRNVYRSVLQAVGPRLGVRGCPFGGFTCHCAVLSWNDAEGRNRRDVVAKLDEVIHAALRSVESN
jgi:Tfp pilus assembly protein PilZ